MSLRKAMSSRLVMAWLAFAAMTGHGHAAERDTPYHIYMMLYRGCEQACQGFQDHLRRRGLPVRYTIRDAAQDKSRIPDFVAEAKAMHPDLVVTWGTTLTREVVGADGHQDPQRHITGIPVVFMIVSSPVADGIVRSLESPGRNVTGSLYLIPVETQLRGALNYFRFKTIGFPFNPGEQNSASSRTELLAAARRMGLVVVEKRLPTGRDGNPVAGKLPQLMNEFVTAGVDLVYQPPDTFLNTQRDAFTRAAVNARLPVLAAAEAPVKESQALLGIVNEYAAIGRFTAQQAEKILVDQIPPARIPITLPRSFSYLINLPVAAALDRYPPLKLLDVARLVSPANQAGDH